MKECSPNSRFNCSPYIKYIFAIFILGLALASCSQDVRVDDNIKYNSSLIVVENGMNVKVVDRLTTSLIDNNIFASNPNQLSNNIDNIYKFQNELYITSKNANLLNVYDNTTFNLITSYTLESNEEIGDLSFPNISNFYASIPKTNKVVVIDRINKKISATTISVDNNPNKLFTISNLLFVGCDNSINVIRTGSNLVENKISITGKVDLFCQNEDGSVLIAVTSNDNKYYLEYYNTLTYELIKKTELKSSWFEEGKKIIFNQVALVYNDIQYGWIGSNAGLIRIDLKNYGTYNVISNRKEEILNVYYEPISNYLLILTARNQLKDYTLADPSTGEVKKSFAFSNDTKLIFPI